MNRNEPQAPESTDLPGLKAQLNDFIVRSSVTRFESDDILELIGDGESIDWIVDQLKSDSPGLDEDATVKLLTAIRTKIKPEETAAPGEAVAPDIAVDAESGEGAAPLPSAEAEAGTPDLSGTDFSKLDLSQLAKALPRGVKLPPGLDMKQLQNLMESPQGKIMSDFLVFCSEKGVDLDENTLDDPRTEGLRNEWKSTPRDAFGGKTPDEMLEGGTGGLFPEKIKTFRREEPRVGRNDPCPCGSGKKFKKCCGRVQ